MFSLLEVIHGAVNISCLLTLAAGDYSFNLHVVKTLCKDLSHHPKRYSKPQKDSISKYFSVSKASCTSYCIEVGNTSSPFSPHIYVVTFTVNSVFICIYHVFIPSVSKVT
jgi:hypothetical protein